MGRRSIWVFLLALVGDWIALPKIELDHIDNDWHWELDIRDSVFHFCQNLKRVRSAHSFSAAGVHSIANQYRSWTVSGQEPLRSPNMPSYRSLTVASTTADDCFLSAIPFQQLPFSIFLLSSSQELRAMLFDGSAQENLRKSGLVCR